MSADTRVASKTSLSAALVAIRLVGRGLSAIQKSYVGLMVAGMLVAWLPYLIASSAGVEDTDIWNLTVVALPVAFAMAFFGIRAAGDLRRSNAQ